MKPEEQRIAIVEWCGWYRLPEPNNEFWAPKGWVYGRDVYGELRQLETLPDYLNDLNAMHEAENRLDDLPWIKGWGLFINRLIDVTNNHSVEGRGLIHATAAQRAEALLRTIGKWTDSTLHTKG